jgi:23S rRNA U2552 (ribose-2'-O)-methylase RlmE/FtsJ
MEFMQPTFTSKPIDKDKPKQLTYLSIRKSLDDLKNKLGDVLGDRFYTVIKYFDYYRFLKYNLEGTKPISGYEFNYTNVSNAWLKLYEMIVHLKLDVSTHLAIAELPGSFVCAAEAYANTRNLKHEWLASSYYIPDPVSNIFGDKYGLVKQYPEKWIGKTGDLTDLVDIRLQISQVRDKWPDGVQLITSDAGVGMDGRDVNEQEEACLGISIGDAIMAVSVLKKGGCMISKKFTFSTNTTRVLFALLRNCFERAAIVKPSTSRPANSEVYFYGESFIGISEEDMKLLESMFANPKDFEMTSVPRHLAIYIDSIDKSFIMYATEQIKWLNQALILNTSYFKDARDLSTTMAIASSKMIRKCTYDYIKNIILHNL